MSILHDRVEVERKPRWLKSNLHVDPSFGEVERIVKEHSLCTICSSGMCPNKAECWSRRTATFMIMGDICTRNCRFCATQSGVPLPLESLEPQRVAHAISLMGLRHAVITSVTRDDLPDGGAEAWAETVRAVREQNPSVTIELLIPDLDGKRDLLKVVHDAGADIVGHNIETVERLTPLVRSRASYAVSMQTLSHLHQMGSVTKSGLMLGLGEREEEVLQALRDLREVGVSIVTLGQYLRPTLEHYPVAEYVTPEKFEWYRVQAMEMGFSYCASAPLVRSSYLADEAMAAIESNL